jgi:hypothetical protein
MKRYFSVLFMWSWLLTLPATVFGTYWAWQTADRYWTFVVRYDSGSLLTSLLEVGQQQFELMTRQLRLGVSTISPPGTALESINLFVPQSNLSKLNSHLPQTGFRYVKARMLVDGRLIKAKMRYRGTFVSHWGYRKKSIRIKTSKGKLYKGLRTFNLIAPKYPEHLNNYLGYRLAADMGLIAPDSRLVRVNINGEDQGVHILVEQLKELTLRRNNLMPADIYRGELIGRHSFDGATVDSLFFSATAWDKISTNNHYDLESNAPMEKLIEIVKSRHTELTQKSLAEILDLEAWGKFSAFEALTQNYHYDDVHNWRIYYDPWRQKFIPIVWDPAAWAWGQRPGRETVRAIVMTRLHEALFLNGDFLRARAKALDDYLTSAKPARFLDLVRQTRALMEQEIQTDPGLRPLNGALVVEAMKKLEMFIQTVFSGLGEPSLSDAPPVSYARTSTGIRLAVGGDRPAHRVRLSYGAPITRIPTARIIYLGKYGRRTIEASGGVTVSGNDLMIEGGFLPNLSLNQEAILPHPDARDLNGKLGTFEVAVSDAVDPADLVSVSVDLGSGWQLTEQISSIELAPFDQVFMPASERPLITPLRWSGRVEVTGTMVIDQPLVIGPGTDILMAEGASLIVKRRLLAEGRANAPIRFVPAKSGQKPWGTVALLGRTADGSRLANCEMAHGGGLKGALFEYSAMFSIHGVRDVKISDCLFRDSKLVDDMVHAVYSSIKFKRSVFRRSFSDALDLDISEATIENSVFEDSGNDAIDLMTTRAYVIDTVLKDSGDKAISVGEGSQLVAANNLMMGNSIGVQAKDGSTAILFNHTMSENKKALDSYKKNWRYNGGGEIFATKSFFINNSEQITLDKHSEIQIFDSYLDGDVKPHKRLKLFGVDARDRKKAMFPGEYLPPSRDLRTKIEDVFGPLNNAILINRNDNRRGTRPDG